MDFEASALVLAWVAIILLAFAMSGLTRQLHALSGRSIGLESRLGPTPGDVAPPLDGAHLGWPHSSILLFADVMCPSCNTVLPVFRSLADKHLEIDFTAVFPNDADGFESGRVRILHGQADAFESFHIPVKPFAVAIAPGGVITDSRPIGNARAMREFVAQTGRTRDDP